MDVIINNDRGGSGKVDDRLHLHRLWDRDFGSETGAMYEVHTWVWTHLECQLWSRPLGPKRSHGSMIFVVLASLEAGGRAAYHETRDSVMAGDASALLAAVQDSTERQPAGHCRHSNQDRSCLLIIDFVESL